MQSGWELGITLIYVVTGSLVLVQDSTIGWVAKK